MSAGEVEAQRRYIPAATYDWLLPLYDVFARVFGTDAAHRQLVDRADIEPARHVASARLQVAPRSGTPAARCHTDRAISRSAGTCRVRSIAPLP